MVLLDACIGTKWCAMWIAEQISRRILLETFLVMVLYCRLKAKTCQNRSGPQGTWNYKVDPWVKMSGRMKMDSAKRQSYSLPRSQIWRFVLSIFSEELRSTGSCGLRCVGPYPPLPRADPWLHGESARQWSIRQILRFLNFGHRNSQFSVFPVLGKLDNVVLLSNSTDDLSNMDSSSFFKAIIQLPNGLIIDLSHLQRIG